MERVLPTGVELLAMPKQFCFYPLRLSHTLLPSASTDSSPENACTFKASAGLPHSTSRHNFMLFLC